MNRLIAASLLMACQRQPSEPPCQELARYAPDGVTLASEEQRCIELLEFASTTKQKYGLEFGLWLQTVVPQRALFMLDAVSALTDPQRWQPMSFSPQPVVPCGGLVVTDAVWTSSVLSNIIQQKPDKMYVSLGISVEGNLATIRVIQDFNCDNQPASTVLIGRFKRGLDPLAGGWDRISTSTAEIDE